MASELRSIQRDGQAGDDLLLSLRRVRWHVAFRTFGNDHATLIGLLVDWWVSGSPETRWALEGGPSFGYREKGQGGGLCDAVLGEGDTSRGVVEVEGTRYDETIRKIGRFFASTKPGLTRLEFGVFLAYAYSPVGQGSERHFEPLPLEHFVELGKVVTASNPGKALAILALDKHFGQRHADPRALDGWYLGWPAKVQGVLLVDGTVAAEGFHVSAPPDAS